MNISGKKLSESWISGLNVLSSLIFVNSQLTHGDFNSAFLVIGTCGPRSAIFPKLVQCTHRDVGQNSNVGTIALDPLSSRFAKDFPRIRSKIIRLEFATRVTVAFMYPHR